MSIDSMDRDSHALLRAIAKLPDSGDLRMTQLLAAEVSDWDSLLWQAHQHRVLPILYSRLSQIGTEIPQAAQKRLETEYRRNVLHNLANAAELIEALKAFEHEMIPAMPFKGVVLGASIYDNIAIRTAGDLDLLIYSTDLVRATAVLRKRGYELTTQAREDGTPAAPDCYEYRFERAMDGMVLELRWRLELVQGRFGRNLGMDWIWPRRQTVALAGAEVPDMSPEQTLLLLCMHGSKHLWSRLLWIYDVAQLLAAKPDLDWTKAIHEAKTFGLWRTLALGVLLAHRISGAAVPKAALRGFAADAAANRIAQHVEATLFDAPGSAPVGRLPYNVQLLDFRDRIRLLLSRDFLQPNELDRAAVPLPRSLHAAYYLIRPVRILLDRSARW